MMRFTVDARAFSDAMSKVSKVLRKSPLPILEEIAVCIQHGRCTLTATDLETWLVAEIPTLGDDMSFVLSRTKDVMKACSHFEGELAITLVFKDEKDGTLEVRCGQRAAEFSVSSHEDYPECGTVEDGTSLRVNAAALFRRIERVRYAAEKGCLDRRPQSACVQFREDRIFSLDGRRMACDTQPDTVFPVPCLMLGDALTHLRAFGENEVTVQIGAHKVCFSDETLKLYVRRYGVDTYDPDAAIPKAYREVITVQTDELLRELTYLKECVGSCTFPYVRFAGKELSMNVPTGRFATRVSMVGRGDLAIGFTEPLAEIAAKVNDLGTRYKRESVAYKAFHAGMDCPTCHRRVTEETLPEVQAALKKNISELYAAGTEQKGQLTELQEMDKKARDTFDAFKEADLRKWTEDAAELERRCAEQSETSSQAAESLRSEIQALTAELEYGNLTQAEYGRLRECREQCRELESKLSALNEMASAQTPDFDREIREAQEAIGKIKRTMTNVISYVSKRAELTFSQLKMNRVEISLYDVVKSTGEVKDTFKFTYSGRR